MANNKGLGRGLEALFGSAEAEFDKAQEKAVSTADTGGASKIPMEKVYPNPDQPRKRFEESALAELADSILRHGVLQPIIVNQNGGRYMIIAGERRWRAAKIAGLTEIPAVVQKFSESQIKEVSLIENLQREDLNAIEAAQAIQKLMAEHKYTQEAVAGRVGKSRPYVTNLLRLLELLPEVQMLVQDDRLSAGHAKVLLSLKDRTAQARLAKDAADGKMSVRELEKAVKHHDGGQGKAAAPQGFAQSLELKELKNAMQRAFGTKVEIFGNDNKGRIYIDYFNRDDIDRIAQIINDLEK